MEKDINNFIKELTNKTKKSNITWDKFSEIQGNIKLIEYIHSIEDTLIKEESFFLEWNIGYIYLFQLTDTLILAIQPDLKNDVYPLDKSTDYIENLKNLKTIIDSRSNPVNSFIHNFIKSKEMNKIEIINSQAMNYSIDGEYEKSIEYLNMSLDIDKNQENLYVMKATIYNSLGNIEDAINSYHQLLSINWLNPEYYLNISEIYFDSGKHTEAIDVLHKCLSYYLDIPSCTYEKYRYKLFYCIAKNHYSLREYSSALRSLDNIDINSYKHMKHIKSIDILKLYEDIYYEADEIDEDYLKTPILDRLIDLNETAGNTEKVKRYLHLRLISWDF